MQQEDCCYKIWMSTVTYTAVTFLGFRGKSWWNVCLKFDFHLDLQKKFCRKISNMYSCLKTCSNLHQLLGVTFKIEMCNKRSPFLGHDLASYTYYSSLIVHLEIIKYKFQFYISWVVHVVLHYEERGFILWSELRTTASKITC